MKIFGAHFLTSLLIPFIAFGYTLAGPVLLTEHIARDRNLIARQNEISTIFNVANDVAGQARLDIDWSKNTSDQVRNARAQFTQGVVSQLSDKFSGRNVICFGDSGSKFTYQGDIYYHYNLDLGLMGVTYGYNIYVFSTGTFVLAGDGGYENWAFAGNFVRNGNTVKFSES